MNSEQKKKTISGFGFLAALSAIVPLLICCFGQFPTRYERIEDDRVRQLGLVFSSAEAAPGDTVTITALFSGESVDSVIWRISLDYRFDPLGLSGADTALNVFRIEGSEIAVGLPTAPIQGIGHQYSTATIRLPRELIRTNAMLPQQPLTLVPDSLLELVPEPLRNLGRDDIIDLVEMIAYAQSPGSLPPLDSSTASMVGVLSQLLSVKIMVYADAYSGGYLYKTRGSYVVRYNRLLRRNLTASGSLIPTNENPRPGWFGVYRVKRRNLTTFDPNVDPWDYDLYRLYRDTTLVPAGPDTTIVAPGKRIIDSDTVPIDTGYSYFLGADTGGVARDYGITLQGHIDREDYFYDWFYVPGDFGRVHPDSVLLFGNTRNPIVRIQPPVNSTQRVYDFHLLLFVWDSFLGERLRPQGNGFVAAVCRFSLTEEYAERFSRR